LEAAIPEAGEAAESPALWRDFQTQFFQRLRQQSSPALFSTLDEWERECSRTDHVPRISSPQHARTVRLLARNIIRQLAPHPRLRPPGRARPAESEGQRPSRQAAIR
jgi:hypothetical protein